MKLKITVDKTGVTLWPDIPLEKDSEGSYYDPACEYRGDDAGMILDRLELGDEAWRPGLIEVNVESVKRIE